MTELFSAQWIKISPAERQKALNDYTGGITPIVVVVDDEGSLLESINEKIANFGFSTFGATKASDAINYIKAHKGAIALVLSDVQMPEMDGFNFRKNIATIAPEIPFVMMSGFVDRATALKGVELKIVAFLEKPIVEKSLQEVIETHTMPRLNSIKEDRELLKGFTDDASNLMEQIEELVLELEENPHDQDSLSKIFGMIHTIKGSSGFFEPRTLHTFAHRFEDTLKDVQTGRMQISEKIISVWLQACDILKNLIEEFRLCQHNDYNTDELTALFQIQNDGEADAHGPGHGATTHRAPEHDNNNSPRAKGPQELKVAVSLLDEFMQISGEMTVIRNMINKIVRSIEKQYPADKDVALLSELLGELHKINGSVQSKIIEIRKVPVRSVVKPLTRIIRDTSQALKKEADLKVEGEEIRIDNSVAEVLSNSLIHLIRNSMDHGIENPEERTRQGKNPRGEISINTKINGEFILVEIKDDGKGINPDAIRKKLVSNGTHTLDQVQRMSIGDLQQMIFSSGFSTAAQITDISGRGVGMSMVKTVVEAIGGKILIDSEMGKGTLFTLRIPIPKSVLITNCLFVTSGHMQFGVPQDQIKRVITVQGANERHLIDHIEGAYVLRLEEELLPIVSLAGVLKGNFSDCPSQLDSGYLVILTHAQQQFCLWVDGVLDVEDTVVKAITAGQIKNLNLYLGATFLGDGAIGLILNVEGIAHQSHGISLIPKLKASVTKTDSSFDNSGTAYKMDVLLCQLDKGGQYAIPQQSLFRLEEFDTKHIEKSGRFVVTPYRNKMLTFVDLGKLIAGQKDFNPDLNHGESLHTLVIQHKQLFVGLVVKQVLDLITVTKAPQEGTRKQRGCSGWLILGDKSVVLVDVEEILNLISQPELVAREERGHSLPSVA